jgi:hypothetical protein
MTTGRRVSTSSCCRPQREVSGGEEGDDHYCKWLAVTVVLTLVASYIFFSAKGHVALVIIPVNLVGLWFSSDHILIESLII